MDKKSNKISSSSPKKGSQETLTLDSLKEPEPSSEKLIIKIWEDVLKQKMVGITDNFFERGGHSLLGVELITRIQKQLNVAIPLDFFFNHPTIVALDRLIQQTIQRDAAIITPLECDHPPPLSFSQNRIYLLEQVESSQSIHTIPIILKITGNLDIKKFHLTLQKIVDRHESLRTGISRIEVPHQIIMNELKINLPLLNCAPKNVEENLKTFIEKKFDLHEVPLWRAILFKITDNEFIFAMALHQCIADNESKSILIKELATLYESQQLSKLPNLPIQYADYAVWQKNYLESDHLKRALQFWQSNLSNAPTLLDLPTDMPRPAFQKLKSQRYPLSISSELIADLRELSHQQMTTLYFTLLSSFYILLSKHTNQKDIIIGIPIANRNRKEIKNLIGYFENTLALRIKSQRKTTFIELLKYVERITLEAQENQDVPFENLLDHLKIERSLSYSPLFQVMFDWKISATTSVNFDSLNISEEVFIINSLPYDLKLTIKEEENELNAFIDYATDLFTEENIKCLSKHWQILLEEIVENPNLPVANYSLLSDEEKKIIWEWNLTKINYDNEKTLHQLFEEQANKTPALVAIKFENDEITYQELNTRANQLAHQLLKQGVGPETLVAICMERSINLIIGLLGILKAGAAYVPIDPDYPQNRKQYLYENSKAKAWVDEKCFEALDLEPMHNPDVKLSPKNLAFVIYTSGTTGNPKGTTLAHSNIVDRMLAVQLRFALSKGERFFHQFSFGFDGAVFSLWWPLLNGSQVILSKKLMDIDDTINTIVKHQPTVYCSTPAILEILLSRQELLSLNLIKKVFFAGQALKTEFIERIRNHIPHLYNAYGPTECAVISTSYEVKDVIPSCEFIPIGKHIGQTSCYILDKFLHPLPRGVIGELYLGGKGLARGYLNRPELTAERFLPNPFEEGRLYKTGDICRYLPDGNIEYIGRDDFQVKIRGFRIELGEIEFILRNHPGINEAIVLAREDEPGIKRLVAYYKAEEEIPYEILYKTVSEKLPNYMVPYAFIHLEEFPITPNGKLDRNALPAPMSIERENELIPPRNAVEKALLEVWQTVLKHQDISVKDDFFQLGGDSILNIQVISLLHPLGYSLKASDVFRYPTLELLASVAVPLNKNDEVQLTHQSSSPYSLITQADYEELKHLYPSLSTIEDAYPQTPMQKGMLFHSIFSARSNEYISQVVYELKGHLNPPLMKKSWENISEQYPIFRTCFIWEGVSEFLQVVHNKVELPWKIVEESNDHQIHEILAQDRKVSFDLHNPPLMRILIIKKDIDHYLMVWTHHHMLIDGWSLPIVQNQVMHNYRNLVLNVPIHFNVEHNYRTYIEWLKNQDNRMAQVYWMERLKNFKTATQLGIEKHRSIPTHEDDQIELKFHFNEEMVDNLYHYVKNAKITLNSLLQGAWALLLKNYTHQQDIVFGSVVSGRSIPLPHIDKQVGLFINVLPTRVNFKKRESIKNYLKRFHEEFHAAQEHAYLPLWELHKICNISNETSLFQHLFVYQNFPTQGLAQSEIHLNAAGLKLSNSYTKAKTNYALTVLCNKIGHHLNLEILYAKTHFNPTQIKRLLQHYEMLLLTLINSDEVTLDNVSLLLPDEKQKIFNLWNLTSHNYPKEKSLSQLFEKQVHKTPNEIAVIFGENQLTYQELNERANQLGHYLKSTGVSLDQLVAVYLNRSIELVIAMLAIWKVGGGYVPIDTNLPPDRLHHILEDTKAKIVITNHLLQSKLNQDKLTILDLDTDTHFLANQSKKNLPSISNALGLSYVIYTSGSTGKPKGVGLTHQTLTNLIQWQSQDNAISHLPQRVSQFANVVFDVSLQEISYTLLNGFTLYLVPKEIKEDLAKFVKFVDHNKINQIFLPTIVLEYFTQEAISLNLELLSLSHIIVAGEALRILPIIQKFFTHYPHIQLINHYGPSESHVVSSLQLTSQSQPWAFLPSIGKPINNIELWILDPQLNPVPIGVSGELYISGINLARGYLNRPDLTAEKFIPNPFNEGRLYKTGDICRHLSDGNIEYVERIDNQVKIRGFRIEIGEIENLLINYKGIDEAVVIAREAQQGNKYLVAYYVSKAQISPHQIKEFLTTSLPHYMIPAFIVTMERLPITANGKLDRKALPLPEPIDSDTQYQAPRNRVEQQLVSIWEEVLQQNRIGVKDNFFERGGHSLSATRVVSRIRNEMKSEISLEEFFKATTIENLIGYLKLSMTSEEIPLKPLLHENPTALSFSQQRLWFLNEYEKELAVYNIPCVLRIYGKLNFSLLQKAWQLLVDRHESLRTTFIDANGQGMQRILKKIEFEIPIISCTAIEAKKMIDKDIHQGFNLTSSPLWRIKLLKISENETIFLFVIHHIICDGWSLNILTKEMMQIYQGLISNENFSLSPLPLQYADYALWQRNLLQGEHLDKQLSYWADHLSGSPPLLTLPINKTRPALQNYKGKNYSLELSLELTQQLKILSQNQESTLFMTLLGAFYVLLSRYSNQSDIVVGTPIANRNKIEIESVVGFFVNTLALRAQINLNNNFKHLLNQIKKITLNASEHQNLPFEKLVRHLEIERNLSYSPLFQVMFILQPPSAELNIDNLDIISEKFTYEVSKFDLTFSLKETSTGLHTDIEYASALFTEDAIKRLATHWKILLEGIVRNPEMKLANIPLLSVFEEHKIFTDWNATDKIIPNKLLHQWFEDQVKITPESIAIAHNQRKFTYNELNAQANQLANFLRSQGIEKEDLIAVCLDRSINLIISILGILKAGAAYVPIDPAYPAERQKYILENSKARVIINRSYLSLNDIKIKMQNHQNLELSISKSNLGYVIYTSGSTGLPKGVAITHQNTGAFLHWVHSIFTPTELNCVLWGTSICFDLSIFEIFSPLSCGGQIIVSQNPLNTDEWINQPITLINTVPSVMNALLKSDTIFPSTLKVVNVAGEPFTPHLTRAVYSIASVEKFYNLYGPTEDTTYSTFTLISRSTKQKITIGKSIQNSKNLILDQNLQLVPIGVIGELYLSGEGLARGYLNKPDLTADRFIPNPFSEGRLYKTGDLCRYLPDGNIDYVGRSDFQVKVRGFRIELGEIESALIQISGIKDVVILARENEANDKYLIAYYTGNKHESLREILSEHLPDHMIPSAFIHLDKFPLTPNGKLDRKALPNSEDISRKGEFVPPRNETEKFIAEVWQTLLNQKHVSIHDNFFELGGHSLLTTQLLSQLNKHFGKIISLKEFFRSPTVASLAASITIPKESLENNEPLYLQDLKLIEKLNVVNPSPIDTKNFVIPKAILLTGATGFLGCYLLKELLSTTQATIYCLVKPRGNLTEKEYLTQKLSRYGLEDLVLSSRIVAIRGNLNKAKLGMQSNDYEKIANEVSSIYHCGAKVNHLYDYSLLRESNVFSTFELLKLASVGTFKNINFISTLSANLDVDKNGKLLESFPVKLPSGHEGGYVISKWVAEKLLEGAKNKGHFVTIYRPNQIMGDSQTGVSPTDNIHVLMYIKGCLQMGYAPNDNATIDVFPVDYIARLIVHSSQSEKSLNKVFNLSHPLPIKFKQLFSWLKNQGYSIEIISMKEWKQKCSEVNEKNALYPLLSLYLANSEFENPKKFLKPFLIFTSLINRLFKINKNVITQNMNEFIKANHLPYPSVNKKLFIIYFKYLKNWFYQ